MHGSNGQPVGGGCPIKGGTFGHILVCKAFWGLDLKRFCSGLDFGMKNVVLRDFWLRRECARSKVLEMACFWGSQGIGEID
jgi:hypothetical protein